MAVVNPGNLFFMYMSRAPGPATMDDMTTFIHHLLRGPEDVYSPIDKKYYNGEFYSDVLYDELWFGLSSGLIEELPERRYQLTDFGRRMAEYYERLFKESDSEVHSRISNGFDRIVV